MNNNGKKAKRQAVIKNSTANILSPEELARRIAAAQEGMRAVDSRGRELSRDAFPFSNSEEGLYADLRRLSMLRDQLTEDRIRNTNRLHREMKIYFPEYMDAFGKLDGAFTLEILKAAPFPEDILKLGTDGLKSIWHEAKLRGRGYSRAEQIVRYAGESMGLKHGTAVGRKAVKIFAEQMIDLAAKLDEIEAELHRKCRERPYAENILELNGIGENILSGILSEMGDITRFDDAREIQKLSGLGLVACSSGKHKGETKISHRGCKKLRYWLFQAVKSVVSHAEEFKILHEYYTTRPDNPLKNDPGRMLKDIKHTAPAEAQAASLILLICANAS